ncbi:MAG: hypothetical protein ABJN40_20930 [Sneathiella sp.]
MKNLIRIAAGALLAGMFAFGSANAATFDFVELADAGAAPNYGEIGGNPLSFLSGSIGLDATATKDGLSAFAYLDKSGVPATHEAPAGMGVCGALTGAGQCNPGSDDNVTTGEILKLTFSEAVFTADWGFNGPGHGNNFSAGDVLELSIDGGPFMAMALDVVGFTNFDGLTGTTFELKWAGTDFYIAKISAVPLPPAVLLFGAALAGLGWLGRRRRKIA